jgi:hypothetical protein
MTKVLPRKTAIFAIPRDEESLIQAMGFLLTMLHLHRRPFHNFSIKKPELWVFFFNQVYFLNSLPAFNFMFSLHRIIYILVYFIEQEVITVIAPGKGFLFTPIHVMFD